MLSGSNNIFNIILLFNIITPLLIVIFLKKPWEKIPIFYGILILYIILSAWILHFFNFLNPFIWRTITILLFSLFLLFAWKKRCWLQIELKETFTFTFTNTFLYILIIGWVCITYFRVKSLPVILSDARAMHLFQQSVYFQECSFLFHNSNTWESAFRPINALLWNMFFSIFLEDNILIEAPQIISWLGLILISGAIFSQLKVNDKLAGLVMLCIGFSPRILSLSTNNFIDLPSLLYFSGIIYFLIKFDQSKTSKIIDLLMLGTFCGAYLGARIQGIILVPLLLVYFLIAFSKKRSRSYKVLMLPITMTILLGIGKYLINYSDYGTPIPLSINDSTTLSLKKLFKNFTFLINNILDRSWNFYGFISFQANSAIVGFLISFFIIPYAFYGFLNKKYNRMHKSSFSIFIIGLIFLLISILSLESPSQNYLSRLWIPFIFTTIVFGTDIINTLIKENKIIIILSIFLLTILFSVINYGGVYRKGFVIILFITIFYLVINKTIDTKFLLISLSCLAIISSLGYSMMNIVYDKYSPILDYKEINQKHDQQSLVKLSKYFLPKDKVGFLNFIEGHRIPIYDLFGNKHDIHARLVFDWVDKKDLKNLNEKDLKGNFDYLLIYNNENKIPLAIEGFSFIENFDGHFIYRNKKKNLIK